MGLQGYSVPTEPTIVFSIRQELVHAFEQVISAMFDAEITLLVGVYNGKEEYSYAAPEAVFHELQRRWPMLFEMEETVLRLGAPKSQNKRPASLIFLKEAEYCGNMYPAGYDLCIGYWVSSHEDGIRGRDYTRTRYEYFGGIDIGFKYWVIEKNPSDCVEEDKHREHTELLIDQLALMSHVFYAHDESRLRIAPPWPDPHADPVTVQYGEACRMLTGKSSQKLYDTLFDTLVGRRRVDGTVLTRRSLYAIKPRGVK